MASGASDTVNEIIAVAGDLHVDWKRLVRYGTVNMALFDQSRAISA